MTPIKVKGARSVRLHSPEVRRLEEAALVLRQMAVAVDDPDEVESMNNIGKCLEEYSTAYSRSAKEQADGPGEANPPFAPEKKEEPSKKAKW